MKGKILPLCSALLLLMGSVLSASEPLQEKLSAVDSLMNEALETLHIPGMAVGIVMDGQVVFIKGYGVRSYSADQLPVSKNTLFAIGSCSKSFTTLALGQLVDEGSLSWDDPVIKYIPEFRLHDIHATHHLTIRDLVAHRSGLPRHDFVWYNSQFSRQEILNRLPYLEPICDLREKFQYNNLMYAVAGLVIERVSGQSWETFVQEHVFNPLGMLDANFSVEESQKSVDYAAPHREKDGQIAVIPFRNLSNIGPAGSINASVEDMTKWVELQLSETSPFIHKATLEDMHIVHMPVNFRIFEEVPHIFGYGLGWMIGLYKGCSVVTHGGGIDGFISNIVLLPEKQLGIVVLTNTDSHPLFATMAPYAIADLLAGTEDASWLSRIAKQEQQITEMLKKTENEDVESTVIRPLQHYVGEFEHPGYGVVDISLNDNMLVMSHNGLAYTLKHKCYDHFRGYIDFLESPAVPCFFTSDSSGDITEFHIAIESKLAPIAFKRQTSSELFTSDYLKKFVGNFECPLFSVEISMNSKGLLVATISGQSPYEMKPEKNNLFLIKEIPGCSIQFIVGSDHHASELQVHQAGQIFRLQPKTAD